MIYEGMSTEALAVVEAVRRRHDGERRNPWNEPECGHHYARALSSWAVLLACSGFHYSGVERRLKLASRIRKSSLRSFWSVPSGWGTYARSTKPQQQRIAVEVTEGKIALDQVLLQESASKQDLKTVSVRYGTETVPAKSHQDKSGRVIVFEKTLELNPEHPLAIVLS